MRKFLKSESGNFAVITALAMVPIMAAVAGAVDFVSINNKAEKLQNSLDAAALAIATQYYSGMTKDELTGLGRGFFDANLRHDRPQASDLIYNDQVAEFSASATPSGENSHIEVKSTIEQQGMIGGPIKWRTARRSVAQVAPGDPACVLALDPHASSAVKLQGSTEVALKGCVIAANSDANDSVSRGGSAKVTAECVNTVGGTSGLSGSSTKLKCGAARERQYVSIDPLANVVPPAYTAPIKITKGSPVTLSPGTYVKQSFTGGMTLLPGTYILRGGEIKLNGGDFTGTGVTIFLMEGAEFTSNGNSKINLTPPTSGPYAGITIYQEKANTNEVKINGGAASNVSGFIYAPGALVFYAGNSSSSGAGECIRLVAKTIEMTGNSSVASDCDAELGGRKLYAGRIISLVR